MKKHGRGFIWTKEEEQYLINNYASHNKSILEARFNRSWMAISRKAAKLRLKIDRLQADYNSAWSDKDEIYLKENYKFGDLDRIADTLGRTRKAITERAKLLKLSRDKELVRLQSCKYEVNCDFFKNWSNDMSYVLGLFCADGNMSKDSNCISITLHLNDKYLIRSILKTMESDHKILCPKNKNVAILSIDNKHLHNDLLKLNMTPNKSKTLECPDVPIEFVPDFIRGVMDGDGSVNHKRKRMKIVSASKDFIYGLSRQLDSIDINHKVYNEPYIWNEIETDFYTITVMRLKDIKKLYSLMYNGSDLYMKRKKKAFEDMGVLDEDFEVKCKVSWRAIVGKNITTGEIIKFESIKEAINSGFRKPHLHKALKDTTKSYKNYTWKYA